MSNKWLNYILCCRILDFFSLWSCFPACWLSKQNKCTCWSLFTPTYPETNRPHALLLCSSLIYHKVQMKTALKPKGCLAQLSLALWPMAEVSFMWLGRPQEFSVVSFGFTTVNKTTPFTQYQNHWSCQHHSKISP